jgi:two-component system NtrC family sensor kinase
MLLTHILGKKRMAAAIAGVLLVLLAFLIEKTSSNDFDFNATGRLMRDLKQVDSQWNVDVLSVHAGLQDNFDKTVTPLPRIRQLRENVRTQTQAYVAVNPLVGTELTELLAKYETAMDQKIEHVERVKSSRAILTNSSRFLPIANDQLLEAVRASGDPAAVAPLERALNGMLAGLTSTLVASDPDAHVRVQAAIGDVRTLVPRLRPGALERGELLLSHIDIVVSERDSGKAMLAHMAQLPTVESLDALHDRFMKEQERTVAALMIYKHALVVYAGLLLLLLAFAGRVLFNHYRSLNLSNQLLKTANSENQLLLIQSAKMSAIGQMVAGIAHEINSPLAYVKATFSVLRELLVAARDAAGGSQQQLGKDLSGPSPTNGTSMTPLPNAPGEPSDNSLLDDINTLLDDGMHGIEQITELILTLKNFSRIDRAKRSDFNVHEGLNSALAIGRYMLKRTVDVKKEFQEVPLINCSPSQLNQVFLNIIVNAAQAMTGRAERGLITLRTLQPSSDKVQIDIEDNGIGISPEIMPRIFDQFFTTKAAGEGCGAGLAICQQIVRNHGGEIRVKSKVGVGTTFSIVLPVEDGRSHAAREGELKATA